MPDTPGNLFHKLFTHNPIHAPLTVELFRYLRNQNIYELELRCCIARTSGGAVYLGIREIPTSHESEGSVFAAVIVWDLVTGNFTMRDRATGLESVANGLLLNQFKQVDLDTAKPAQRHLGYSIYFVKGVNGVRYCPALEIAMISNENVAGREYENIVRSVQRGEPDLSEFDIVPSPSAIN